MALGHCLSDEDLVRLAQGYLSEETIDNAFSHLEECPQCSKKFEAVPVAADELVVAVTTPIEGTEIDLSLNQSKMTPEETSESLLNTWIGQRRILRKIDSGGMGSVYLAHHKKLDRLEAIKLLPTKLSMLPMLRMRFNREARAFARLDHPHIVRAFDAGEFDGIPFIAMEFLEGSNVAKLLHKHGRIPLAAACEIGRQAALGLAYLHECNLVHRDVKPANLMLTTNGMIKLVDFGIAKFYEAHRESLTNEKLALGTLGYVAPEQLRDGHDADKRADVFALGATLVALISGTPPHEQLRLPENVPQDLVHLLKQMLQPNRDLRLIHCEQIANTLAIWADANALSVFLSDQFVMPSGVVVPLRDFSRTPSDPESPLPRQPKDRAKRLPKRLSGVFVVLLGLIGLGVWGKERLSENAMVGEKEPPVTIDQRGNNHQRWLQLLNQATSPQEVHTAIEAIVELTQTEAEKAQTVDALILLLRRLPLLPDTALRFGNPYEVTLDELRDALILLPVSQVLDRFIKELGEGTAQSQVLSARLLRDVLKKNAKYQEGVRVRARSIQSACMAMAKESKKPHEPLQLYLDICNLSGESPRDHVAFDAFLRKLSMEAMDTQNQRLNSFAPWVWDVLLQHHAETPELEASLMSAICVDGQNGLLPTWERQHACRVLLRMKTLSPPAVDRVEALARELSELSLTDEHFWNPGSSKYVFLNDLLRLLTNHRSFDPLPLWLESLKERSLASDNALELRANLEKLQLPSER